VPVYGSEGLSAPSLLIWLVFFIVGWSKPSAASSTDAGV